MAGAGTMERLARELKLYRISPQDLIKVCNQFFNEAAGITWSPPTPIPDRVTQQSDQEWTDFGDANVPGEFRNVPNPGLVPRSLPTASPETGFPIFRVLWLWIIRIENFMASSVHCCGTTPGEHYFPYLFQHGVLLKCAKISSSPIFLQPTSSSSSTKQKSRRRNKSNVFQRWRLCW